jgi:hypothetical protein
LEIIVEWQLITAFKVFIMLAVVANLNTAVVYRGILTLENVGSEVNYRGIFNNIDQFSCCGMAVTYCSKSFITLVVVANLYTAVI